MEKERDGDKLTPVLAKEEYIEQEYFFRAFRERLGEGRPAQDILAHLQAELLSTTRLPLAVQFMLDELKHSGLLGTAFAHLRHYFTPFQSHVISSAEADDSRFTFEQAFLILEREAHYRSEAPTPAGLFVYQLESLSRNRLGYTAGLRSMELDSFYDEEWRRYIRLVRRQLGDHDFADLIYARSQYYVRQRRQSDPAYEPRFTVLFGEKEGMIAAANRGRDPVYLFATLQRQLGYPEVPRPPKRDERKELLEEMERRLKTVETRLNLLEAEVTGNVDFSKFVVKNPDAGRPRREEG